MTSSLEANSPALERIRGILPEIAERADETEKNRGVAPDLIEKLRKAGLFRLMIPKKYGGEELNQLQACRIIEELAYADAALGWTAMVAFGFNIAIGRYPKETVEALFASGPDVLMRGALAPLGTATPKDGGYVFRGQWPFASGSYKPDWVVAGAIVKDGDKPRMGPMGMPEMRIGLFRPDKAEFLDTWYSVGLRGSDSTDFTIKDQFVPEAYTANYFDPFAKGSFDTALLSLPFGFLTGPTHSAVAIGIVRGALDELGTLAKTKRGAFSGGQRLAQDTVFQHRFGELAVRSTALQALTEKQIADTWAFAQGAPLSPLAFTKHASQVAWSHVEAVDIVNKAFELAGSTPVYSKTTLQRRWRDVRCAAQHFGASTVHYRSYGGMLAGEEMRPGI